MQIQAPEIIDEYYEALLARDSKYVGIFYVGVTTTSVFCIATCRARKPLRKNVVFYSDYADALKEGFRPCKVCLPTQNALVPPEPIQRAIDLVTQHPKQRISDQMLRDEGISPSSVRRWFQKAYGITYHAFQRMYRINNAYIELKGGKTATDAAFGSTYDSLSGFGYTYKKLLGKSPTASQSQEVILIHRLTTPLGPMFVCATDQGICLLEFTDRRMLETEFSDLQKRLKAKILIGQNAPIKQLKKELSEYFEGTRKTFDVPLHTPGTDFQQQVWSELYKINYGTTTTYEQQAKNLGNPKAIRAVARANGYNRIAIVIPCHRVIGKDGSLMGYGGGLARKRWLIDHEVGNM